jgi:hypothetical protein
MVVQMYLHSQEHRRSRFPNADTISIISPDEQREDLIRIGTIEIDEGRHPLGANCRVLARNRAAHSCVFSDVLCCVCVCRCLAATSASGAHWSATAGRRKERHCCWTAACSRFSTAAFMPAPPTALCSATGRNHLLLASASRNGPDVLNRWPRLSGDRTDQTTSDDGSQPRHGSQAIESGPLQFAVGPMHRRLRAEVVRSSILCLVACHGARSTHATTGRRTPASVLPGATVPVRSNRQVPRADIASPGSPGQSHLKFS